MTLPPAGKTNSMQFVGHGHEADAYLSNTAHKVNKTKNRRK